MGSILIISDFNGKIAGQLVEKQIPLVHQFQAGLIEDLILLNSNVQIANLEEKVIYLLLGSLLTGTGPVKPVKLSFFRIVNLLCRLV